MPSFEPNKRHLRELLIYFFILKKSAAEAHRLLVEAYGEAALSERSCREWFQKFKNGKFDIEDKERSGKPKVHEDAELEALLDEDSCQTQKQLALTLGATQQAISHRLKSLGMIQKQGNWVPYELKRRNVERRFSICEMLLVRHKQKGFLHRTVTGDEKWIHYDNPKKRKSWGYLGAIYQTQLMRLSRALKEKRAHCYSRHDKIILLHDNARPHVAAPVKTYMETLNWEVLPHPPYSDIAPSDYHLFRSMAHGLSEQHFTSYEDIKNWIDKWIASKDEAFFQRGIRMLPERWEKVVASDGQYFNKTLCIVLSQ
ncbi:MOS1T transposase, partial [Pseudoatta argentina]